MYAIVDIETTGGKYNEEGITEIAIYKYDGHEIVDQFISLVNPEKEIQPFVVNLTGITNKMLVTAPKFFEVAKRIIEITEGCIIVAHNSQFDYRILRTEFKRLGFDFEKKTLCTVELSKKLIPGKESYSLGKLVRSLGIPVSDRHRASGDALATVKLFQLLLAKDTSKTIVSEFIKKETLGVLTPKLIAIVEELPSATGVYYIHNKKGELIYIGKSKNIKRRVNQHFTGTASKALKIQKMVASVTFEKTGSELVALLKESEEIKIHSPILNRAQKRTLFQYGLYSFMDTNGYLNFKIEKAKNNGKPITTFVNMMQAKSVLLKIAEEFNLCHKLSALETIETQCFNYALQNCNGACIQKEESAVYNNRVTKAIEKYSFGSASFILIDQGRAVEEKSAILIENGVFKGIAFYNLNFQINSVEILNDIITPMKDTPDAHHIIQSFLRKKNRIKKIIY